MDTFSAVSKLSMSCASESQINVSPVLSSQIGSAQHMNMGPPDQQKLGFSTPKKGVDLCKKGKCQSMNNLTENQDKVTKNHSEELKEDQSSSD